MATPSWLEDVQNQLVVHGMPAAYRERILGELGDHIEEIRCEERNHAMSTETLKSGLLDTRLGKPAEIAAAAEQHVAHVFFARRHPVITYLLVPIPILAGLWFAYTLGLAGILSGFESFKDRAWAVSAASVLVHGVAYVPAILLTLALAWIAMRSETKITWWLAGSALVALVSGMMMVSLQMPTTPGTGTLQVGVGFPPALAQWPQVVVPLAITLGFAAHAIAKRRSLESTESTGA